MAETIDSIQEVILNTMQEVKEMKSKNVSSDDQSHLFVCTTNEEPLQEPTGMPDETEVVEPSSAVSENSGDGEQIVKKEMPHGTASQTSPTKENELQIEQPVQQIESTELAEPTTKTVVLKEIPTEIPKDKRSALVDRKRAIRQVLCYICCSEFGTNSLTIHHKTCLKKHAWGLNNILNDESMTRQKAEKLHKKCTVPGSGPTRAVPNLKTPAEEFEDYNKEALEIFFEHAKSCLWCREKNTEALEAARLAEEAARRKALEDEARRLAEEEEARRLAAEAAEAARLKALDDQARRLVEEEEARRRAAEEADARRRREEEEARRAREAAEAEARRLAAEAELERQRQLMREMEEERRMAAEEAEARRLLAEEAERQRKMALRGQHKYLVKGGGHIASQDAAKIHNERKTEQQAREDIAKYSLSHAKKEGLVAAPAHKIEKEGGVRWVEVDDNGVEIEPQPAQAVFLGSSTM